MVKKWPLFQLFFLGSIGKENVFYDILERKNAFLCFKNIKTRKSKNWHFSKGVNPWFWCKNGHFFNFFFLLNKGQENVFYDILEQKNAFVAYKKKKFIKSKNWKLFHDFGPKMAIFPTFFLMQYRPAKCLLRYTRAKKRLSRL